MNFLMDENIPRLVIQQLRELGHDVISVKELIQGVGDRNVISKAVIENRIIVTRDKDFGELIYQNKVSKPAGIILIRLFGYQPDELISKIVTILCSREDWTGHFSVIRNKHIRIKPF
jgi:predicted nuclease of predicted toxin-antitoxin system